MYPMAHEKAKDHDRNNLSLDDKKVPDHGTLAAAYEG
jgi:hypothetical protein